MINHIVVIRWKTDASNEQVHHVIKRMEQFSEIEGVAEVSVAKDLGKSKSEWRDGERRDVTRRTHILFMKFTGDEALAAFGVDPRHHSVISELMPLVEDMVITDH